MMWRIEQQDKWQWKVYKGEQIHWAWDAEGAVALVLALEAAGR
jgi:hypothetical protein